MTRDFFLKLVVTNQNRNMEYIDPNNRMFDGLIKLLHSTLMKSGLSLDEIQEILTMVNFTQPYFDALCIYHYTQNIRIKDGYICGCAMLKMCRVAEACSMKPSSAVSNYISQRINICGGTSEMETVEKWLGITCQTEVVS